MRKDDVRHNCYYCYRTTIIQSELCKTSNLKGFKQYVCFKHIDFFLRCWGGVAVPRY